MSEFDKRVQFLEGDLTLVEADAIVCPSLPDLDVLKTGVAGAIFRRGGERIFMAARKIAREARKLNPDSEYPVPLCSAHLTTGGILPNARYVIHSVSVSVDEKLGLTCDPETIFRSAWNVLDLANGHALRSVAFPALGAGLYGVPVHESLGAIASAATKYLNENPNSILNAVKLVARDPLLKTPSLMKEIVMDQITRGMRPSKEGRNIHLPLSVIEVSDNKRSV